MNDALYEQLVPRKQKTSGILMFLNFHQLPLLQNELYRCIVQSLLLF